MNFYGVFSQPFTLFTPSTTPLQNLLSNFQNEFCPFTQATLKDLIHEHFSISQLPYLVAITECGNNIQCYDGFALHKHLRWKGALISPYDTPCNRVYYFVMHGCNQPLELLTTCTSYDELPDAYYNACIMRDDPEVRNILIDLLINTNQYKEAAHWIGYFVRDFGLSQKFIPFFRNGYLNEDLIRENGRFLLQQYRCESYLQRATRIALLSLCTLTTLTVLPHASPELHFVINLGVGLFTPQIQQKIHNIIFNN